MIMNKQRITACVLAALLLSADAFPLGYACVEGMFTQQTAVVESQWKGKRVAFLGDSITDKRHKMISWVGIKDFVKLRIFVWHYYSIIRYVNGK